MYFSKFISVLPLIASICSAKTHFIRATKAQDDVILFAYGTNISGLALAYGNSDGDTIEPQAFGFLLTHSRTCIYH
jgi:hypothetical protein